MTQEQEIAMFNAIKNLNDITEVLISAIDSLDEYDDKYGYGDGSGRYRLLYGVHESKSALQDNLYVLKGLENGNK